MGGYRSDAYSLVPEDTPDIHQKVEGSVKRENNPKSPIKAVGGGLLFQMEAKLPADSILNVLRKSPSGLTAKEVADRLGGTASNIGSRLSKLAAYGVIKQTRGRIAQKASPSAVYSIPLSVSPPPTT